MSEISPEELETLSPEEREAFDAPVQPGDETQAAATVDPDATESPQTPPADEVADGVTAPPGETEAQAQAPAQAEAPAPDAAPAPAAVVPATDEQQLVAAGLPENHADQLKQVETELDALAEKMDEDEVSYAEYSKGTRDLNDKRTELMAQHRDAVTAVEAAKVSRAQAWTQDVVGYLSNKTEFHNQVMHDALQSTLNHLYVDPAYQGKSNQELLEAAGLIVLEATGANKTPAPAEKSTAKAAAEKVAAAVKGAAHDIPMTLGEIPAADGEHIGDNEFGGMDKLTGMEAEDALSRMTPAQQARYGDTRTLHG
jgi:hypothetical protein